MAYESKEVFRKRREPVKVVPKKRVVPTRVKKKRAPKSAPEKTMEKAGEEFRKTKTGAEATFLGKYAVYRAEAHLDYAAKTEEQVSPGAEERFRKLLSSV